MTDSLKKLNKEIKDAFNNVQRQKKIHYHLQSIERKINYKNRDLKRFKKILIKEEQDVLDLEKMSLRSLFTKYLGNIEDRLEVERQEYLHAYLQYDSCLKSLEALYYEQEVLKKIDSELFNNKDRLKDLLKRKKYVLRNSDHKDAHLLIRSEHKIMSHERRIQEIQEAISMGNRVLVRLIKIADQFDGIKSWGPFEYYGKGSNSSSKKKMFIRNAKDSIVQTKILLDKFETELHNVSKQYKLDYGIFVVAFDEFINIFYDALITDWIIQKKIKNASNSLNNFKDKTERIVNMLKHETEATEGYILEERKVIDLLLLG